MSKWDDARAELEAVSEEWWQSAEELNVLCKAESFDVQIVRSVLQRRGQILARGKEVLHRYIKLSGDTECKLVAIEVPFFP